MKKQLTIALIIALSIFAYGCGEDDSNSTVPVQHVLLVYMGGDNNLSGETYQKINAIKNASKKDSRGKIIIYHDPSDAAPQLLEVCHNDKGDPITKTIHQYDEENSADASVLSRVIADTKKLYPAPLYGMLLFSHASGWLPEGTLSRPRSVLADNGQEMNIIDMANAIPDNAFNFIVFEACFMSSIEVAYELKDKTNYLLASSAEILSPGFTDIYSSAIPPLLDGNLNAFAQKAFDNFNSKTGWEQSATFSIIKTSELQVLKNYIDTNADKTKTVDINLIQHFDRYAYHLFFDFEDYYSRLLDTQTQRDELKRLIDNTVTWKAATPSFLVGYSGFVIEKHSGITSYILQDSYPYLNEEYRKLKWNNNR